jgi:hypothetical protein
VPLFFALKKADCLSVASFCLLAKNEGKVAPEVQPLIFFFWYLFFCIKAKEKYTRYL